jgi:circadian clock protein KaiC
MAPTSSYSDDAPLSHRQIDKVPTGVIGLDDVLQGGIPRGGLTLLCGGPGACKTILGLECLVRSAQAGSLSC